MKNDLTPIVLTDLSRLQEVYDLRLFSWINSPNASAVRYSKEKCPNGIVDSLDDSAVHCVLEREGTLIASARLNVFKTLEDIPYKESFKKFDFPASDNIGWYSRLVVHPEHRGKGHSRLLDDFALGIFRENKTDYILGNTTTENRAQSLYEQGYHLLGAEENEMEGKRYDNRFVIRFL